MRRMPACPQQAAARRIPEPNVWRQRLVAEPVGHPTRYPPRRRQQGSRNGAGLEHVYWSDRSFVYPQDVRFGSRVTIRFLFLLRRQAYGIGGKVLQRFWKKDEMSFSPCPSERQTRRNPPPKDSPQATEPGSNAQTSRLRRTERTVPASELRGPDSAHRLVRGAGAFQSRTPRGRPLSRFALGRRIFRASVHLPCVCR